MKLSEHFDLKEFILSATAIELGIDNTPNAVQIACLQSLCDNVLEPLRVHYKSPVRILSGFRSRDLNKAVGGVSTSQHTLGEAADIHVAGIRNDDLWNFINMNLNFDQVIAEKLKQIDGSAGWIHVSHKRDGKQRGDALSFLGDNYIKGLHYIT